MNTNVIAAIWGKEGSGKTTMALTFPKPIVHFDIDVGGYDRAKWRLDMAGMKSTSYSLPIQIEKMMGGEKSGVTIRFPKRVMGYREVWQKIIIDFVKACEDPKVKTIVMDSATQLWSICHNGLLQQKQEIQIAKEPNIQDSALRERLQPVEFPNDRMRSLIYNARGAGKNLVLTHYPKPIYKERFDNKGELISYKSDEVEPDGFKDTTKLVDVVFWTYADEEKMDGGTKITPRAKITIKCGIPGLGMQAVGLELSEPSYQGLDQLIEAMGG